MIGIYKITNNLNQKVYIGQSIDIYQRWKEHKSYAFCPNRSCYNYSLYRSIRKYGLDNFEFSILEECGQEELNKQEQYWIKFYQSNNKEFGYNLILSNQEANHTNIKIDQYTLDGKYIASYNSMREAERITKIDHTGISRCCNLHKGDQQAGGFQWCYSNIDLTDHVYKSRNKQIGQYDLQGKLLKQYSSIKEAAESMGVRPQSI